MHLWFPHFLTNRKIADQVGNDRRRIDGSDTNAIYIYIETIHWWERCAVWQNLNSRALRLLTFAENRNGLTGVQSLDWDGCSKSDLE